MAEEIFRQLTNYFYKNLANFHFSHPLHDLVCSVQPSLSGQIGDHLNIREAVMVRPLLGLTLLQWNMETTCYNSEHSVRQQDINQYFTGRTVTKNLQSERL